MESCVSFIFMSYSFRKTYFFNFFNTLCGNLNHSGQNVLNLVPKQNREKKKKETIISEMRYLNRLRLNQSSFIIWKSRATC